MNKNTLDLPEFEASLQKFLALCNSMNPNWDAYQLECFVHEQGAELLRQIIQDQMDKLTQIAQNQTPSATRLHKRQLQLIFGKIDIKRPAFQKAGQPSIHPLDSCLNLPNKSYSYLLQKFVCAQVAELAYDAAASQLKSLFPGHIPKRQAQACAASAMVDFDAFYTQNETPMLKPDEHLALSFDSKGICMRFESLTSQTQKKVHKQKIEKRLSPGEKSNRKRMATVAAVYSIGFHKRTAAQMVNPMLKSSDYQPPKAQNKRIWASIEKPMETVIEQAFQEAQERDPENSKAWVVLVDGNPAQIHCVQNIAKKMNKKIVIVMDLIHVLESSSRRRGTSRTDGDSTAISGKRPITCLSSLKNARNG